MKKLMRIALVFALAGATLMYTGCTKDYSGDISDLNKKVSEQQAAVTALQSAVSNAQTAADNALASAQNALKEAQAAAKAAADANNDAEVAALTERVAAIEGEIAELEAKVDALDGLEAKLNEVAEQLKKDVNAKVDAALEEVRAELEEALAQVEGNFSVTAPIPGEVLVSYAADVWSPSTTKSDIAKLAKLVEAFPELAEIKKGDAIEMFGKLPFTVSPASLELDDTYSFSLVATNGADAHVALGNPTEGFKLKSTAGVWSVDVMSPAFNANGQALGYKDELALVIEDANGNAAQTQFVYSIAASIAEVSSSNFALALEPGGENANVFTVRYQDPACGFYGNTIDLSYFTTIDELVHDVTNTANGSAPLYENYFLIESTDEADIEKYGVSIDGSEITIDNGPEAGDADGYIQLLITAVGVNGKVDQKTIKLHVIPAYLAPNAELAAKEVILGYKNNSYEVAVDYDMDDFGFSALETKEVFAALDGKSNTVKVYNAKNETVAITTGNVGFFKAGGKVKATSYSDAAIMRVTVKSDEDAALPGAYTIRITDGSVFCAEGALTLVNPETCPIKLIDALCKDGVLQIVGEVQDGNIEYALENALVFDAKEATLDEDSFYDEDQTSSDEDNWVINGTTFCIPVATAEQNLLYTTRNFSVKFGWFTNEYNEGTFEFQAQAVSPIYAEGGKNAVEVANQTIYLGGDDETEFTSFEVNKVIKSAKYVAGDDVNKPYNVFQAWKKDGKVNPTYLYTYTAQEKHNSRYAKAQFVNDFAGATEYIHEIGARAGATDWPEGATGDKATVSNEVNGTASNLSQYAGAFAYNVKQDIFRFAVEGTTTDYVEAQGQNGKYFKFKREERTATGTNNDAYSGEETVYINKLDVGNVAQGSAIYINLKHEYVQSNNNGVGAGQHDNRTIVKLTRLDDKTYNYSGVGAQSYIYTWGEYKIEPKAGATDNVWMKDNNGDYIAIDKVSNNLRGFGLTDTEIALVQGSSEPLMLTKSMVNDAQTTWLKYYDKNGKRNGGSFKDADGKTIYFYIELVKTDYPTSTIDGVIAAWNGKPAVEIKTIFGDDYKRYDKILDGDKNAVAAFETLKSAKYFEVKTDIIDPDAPGAHDDRYIKDTDNPAASEISVVKIGFVDPVTATKFIANVAEITDAYVGSHTCTINVNPDAVFAAGLKSVDIPAYIKIADKWGMTMEIPFTVTVKVASK